MAKIPTVKAVADFVKAYTYRLWAFPKWKSNYQYLPDDPVYFHGKNYYANPDNPPEAGQNPEDCIDRWNLIAGGGSGGGETQTIRRRVKVARPGVKIVNIENNLNLSASLQYRVTPVLATNFPYFRHVFVERVNGDLFIYLYSDSEPYSAPRIGYFYGSTKGTNVKIGAKLIGTFYLGDGRPDVEETPPKQETELRIGDDLVVGQFLIGYVPPVENKIIKICDGLLVGGFHVGEKMPEDGEPVGEIPDEELPGVFIDLFIQREV